jgi:hypothetical protein
MAIVGCSFLPGVVLLLCTSVFPQQKPNALLTVDESKISLHLLPETVLEFPLLNTSELPLHGTLLLEMLDSNTSGKVAAKQVRSFEAAPGSHNMRVEWNPKDLPTPSPIFLGTYRLRYTVVPQQDGAFEPVHGIVQLGLHIKDGFDIQGFPGGQFQCAPDCRFWVRVAEPSTGQPWAGVEVEASVFVGNEGRTVVKQQAITNQDGYAAIRLDLPASRASSYGQLEIDASRGPFRVGRGGSIGWAQPTRLTFTTDKPIYQPGQTVHMRALVFGFDSRAWENAGVIVKITDQNGKEEFHSALVTSKFGVASADWVVPEKVSLGDYSIEAKVDDRFGSESRSSIRISRYDLPAFTVKVAPDRPYYLPGQDATLEISGDYLFGKRVEHGKVRVTEEWAQSGALAEGELDASGKFVAHIDLKERIDSLQSQQKQMVQEVRFNDSSVAVFLTDTSTGRTEQQRFTLRVSLQPIHLYVAQGPLRAGSERSLYITSSYVDGSPASVDGLIETATPNGAGKFERSPDPARRTKLGTFHTNSYGIARVPLPKDWIEFAYPRGNEGSYSWYSAKHRLDAERSQATKEACILIRASDKLGREGSDQEIVSVLPGSLFSVQITTDHVLYRSGDPIHVSIHSETGLNEAVVEVQTDSLHLVAAQVVHLKNGQGELTFPYDPEFRGLLKIWTYAVTGTDEPDPVEIWSSEVIYPAGESLKVGVHLPHTTFRPGEAATADIQVRNIAGTSTESVLGVMVIDRAVEERVRTEKQFGAGIGFSRRRHMFVVDNNPNASIAGITKFDLLNLDPAKPFPDGLDLVAEVLLHSPQTWSGWSAGYGYNFGAVDSVNLGPAAAALERIYKASGRYPATEEELRAELKESGIDPESVRDSWDNAYHPLFAAQNENALLFLVSDGTDKRPDTNDDYVAREFRWPYFHKSGEMLDKAAAEYHAETGKCFQDYPTLRAEMKKRKSVDLDALLDPWGVAYRYTFRLDGDQCNILVESPGPDKKFRTPPDYSSNDDVHEWTSSVRYFVQETADLEHALDEHYAQTGEFPKTEDELNPVLKAAKLTGDRLLDPWGKPYRFGFFSSKRYWDRAETQTYAEYQGTSRKKTEITPVTQQLANIQIVSDSSSGGNVAARFTRVTSERSSKDVRPILTPQEQPRSGQTGGVSGVVTGINGEAIPNATVEVISARTAAQLTTQTDSQGAYSFSALPVGAYQLEFTAYGFRESMVTQVPVQQGGTTKVNPQLEVKTLGELAKEGGAGGGSAQGAFALGRNVTQAVMVEAASSVLQGSAGQDAKPMFTPSLRQYFPETLLWRPEVITDAKGYARVEFPMGDSITAWKMSVVASNLDGKVGFAEQELRTFQPFQIEDDLPKVLTQGDHISLPLTIRNYSDRVQSVTAELKPAPWFSMLSAPLQHVSVPAQSDSSAVFSIVAEIAVRKGTHQVSARNKETGDAVQREVAVHPDGQEISTSMAKLLVASDDTLDIPVPENAIGGSIDTELRVYPNVMAHVLDALHGIDSAYAQCPEIIASKGYANLLVLQLLRKAGQDNADPGNPRAALSAASRKLVVHAQNELLEMQRSDGSYDYCFSYPKRSPISPTAYVLRFLNASVEFAPLDRRVINNAEKYLARQQRRSGAWLDYDSAQDKEVEDRNLTAFAARSLAEAAASAKGSEREEMQRPLTRAMNYLEDQIGSWQDAYLVGNYAIAAAISGRDEYIVRAQELLQSLAHVESATTYWTLESNTSPFSNWGRSGRLETTALAVEALSLLQAKNPAPDTAGQINRGLQFLLDHKDRHGSWYGGLVTHNALEAIVAAMPSAPEPAVSSEATIIVNGHALPNVHLPPGNAVVGPVTIEIADHLQRGLNRVQIRRPGNSSVMNTAAFTTYYIPWKDSLATTEETLQLGESRSLRFDVGFDQNTPATGQTVLCHVEAERIGFRGYGLMIADVGLPPGADVDRESLALAGAKSVLSYEVRSDRVVFYLWPSAGGVKFEFQFRLRYRMEALASASILYDYYNPESHAIVQPVRFNVH